MPVADHFDTLAIYGAAAYRITPADGDPEDLLGEGGNLQSRYEEHGRRALVGVLRDASIKAVLMGDGDLIVEVERSGSGARLQVKWGDDAVVDEHVEIPPMRASWPGPWFRPDPKTEVRNVDIELRNPDVPLFAVADVGGQTRWFSGGLHGPGVGQLALKGSVGAVAPRSLGSSAFQKAHGVRLSYVAGAMAGGIASADLVIAMARAGMLAFFGAGGLPLPAVEEALTRIPAEAGDGAWGFNLLHNPSEPAVEEKTVQMYLNAGVRRVSASAYMGLSKAIVHYRAKGMHTAADGRIVAPNHVFAKVSRPEVAEKFLRPPSQALLKDLVTVGAITSEEAALAAQLPVAEDITAEADSGGHTDHRPLVVLLPELRALRDRIAREERYDTLGVLPRVGAAGGLGTPAALWSAFAMGADYVLTGSVNQATIEAGTSEIAKQMLTQASFFDVASGPAPDMFELGAKVQVLSRGSMYAQRAQRLHDIYKGYDSMEAIPAKERQRIEKQFFKRSLDEIWEGTRAYWQDRDPKQVAKAEKDGRHKMALTFRWYLGMTSRWARIGEADRKRDFQIWCGPAMGAFNSWVAGTELEPLESRSVVSIADALMKGAAAEARIAAARMAGVR